MKPVVTGLRELLYLTDAAIKLGSVNTALEESGFELKSDSVADAHELLSNNS